MEEPSDEWLDLELDLNLSSDHEVIEFLAGDLHCPLCGSAYDHADTHVVREHERLVTLAVQCHCCGTGSLISLERTPGAEAHASELTPVERAFFAYLPLVSDADVQCIRQLMQTHTGDLRDLI